MQNHESSSYARVHDTVGKVALLVLLVIFPIGIGYICISLFSLSAWLSVLIVLASSMVIFLSLVFLLGATVRFPDHLPWYENNVEV